MLESWSKVFEAVVAQCNVVAEVGIVTHNL